MLAGLFLAAAILYSSVGHGGASGYLAAMAFVGLAPAAMRPTALILNVLAATIVTIRFQRAGQIRLRSLAPFLMGSVPMAFAGGIVTVPGTIYRPLVGLVLLFAAARLAVASWPGGTPARPDGPRIAPAVLIGAGIGLLAGLTGTGGGIFLTPLLLFAGWSDTRGAAGMSGAFILANSLAGLSGDLAAVHSVSMSIPLWAGAVGLGAVIGSELGARRLDTLALRRALAVVLVVAAAKLMLLG
ncbi:sulfite exporter TauE/SafE family protein [soil metagenome]